MSAIGKITLTVSQTRTGQTTAIRTTGKRGTVLLNTISENAVNAHQSPATNATAFWVDVLTQAIAALS